MRPPSSTLFPYTTLFRSVLGVGASAAALSWIVFLGSVASFRSGPLGVPATLQVGLAAFSVALVVRSEEHTSELQSRGHLVCRLLLEKKNGDILRSSADMF